MKVSRIASVIASLGAVMMTGWALPASATSDSASWNLKGGDKFQVNAWHCGTYVNSCSWKTSTKLLGAQPVNAVWIENDAELEAHGFSASIKISKEPSATLTMKSSSLGIVRWRNTRAWISDNSGQMSPSWTTAYVSTKSCGSAKVTAAITVSKKCAYAGSF